MVVVAVMVAVMVAVIGVAVVLVVILRGGGDDGGRAASPDRTPSVVASVAPPGSELIGPAPSAAAARAPDVSLGTPRRSRYVSFRGDLLPAVTAGQVVSLSFFADVQLVGRIEHLDHQALLTSWSGPLEHLTHSTFVITLAGGRYQVTASTPQGTYTMSMTRAGLYQVQEVGPALPIDSGPAVPSGSAVGQG